MPARKKPKTKPRAAAAPKSRLTVSAQLARIEAAVKRTLNVVEFLEAEIVKARDAQDEANKKMIEVTPYNETT